MPSFGTNAIPICLKSARQAAGYANRDKASRKLPYSPETIGRHERGEMTLTPENAIVYAECYGREDILLRYCANCPVGRATGRQLIDRDLSCATLRLTTRLRWAVEIADTLERVADDGFDCDQENYTCLYNALDMLEEINMSITEFLLSATTQGIKIGATVSCLPNGGKKRLEK